MSTQRSCRLYGVSRQGLYQRRQRQARQAVRAEQVLEQVRAVRTKLPRLGTRKVLHKIAPQLRAQGVACGGASFQGPRRSPEPDPGTPNRPAR